MTSGHGEDPLHEGGDLGPEDVQPGGEQGAGQECGQGVVQPLHEAPVPHTGRGAFFYRGTKRKRLNIPLTEK